MKVLANLKPAVKAYSLVIGVGVLLSVGFTNCSSPKFDIADIPGTDAAAGIADPNTVSQEQREEIVKKACEPGNILKKRQTIRFPNPRDPASPKKTCNWGKNGNEGNEDLRQSTGSDPDTDINKRTEDRFTARVEQDATLDLPANAVVCNVDFAFPNQKMIYDDHMFFMYDDVVLAATKPIEHLIKEKSGTMLVYNWLDLVMQKWKIADNVAYTYCLGMELNESMCQWPKSMEQGTISLNYSPALLQKVTARNLHRSQHAFRLVTTGDNNPDSDCQHSDLEFDVELSYSTL